MGSCWEWSHEVATIAAGVASFDATVASTATPDAVKAERLCWRG